MEVIRNRNEMEKQITKGGFLDLRYWRQTDVMQQCLKKITEIEHEFLYKKRQPYCANCAVAEVKNKIKEINEKVLKHQERRTEEPLKIDFNIDYDKFGGFEKFEEVDETEIKAEKLLDGIRQSVRTGKYRNFVCKSCGSQKSMEFENREFETERNKIPEKNKA